MRPRGAVVSPRNGLAAATPFRARGEPPDRFLMVPPKLSMWGNGRFGCCVSSEEFAAKAASSIEDNLPEWFMDEQACIDWARAHGVLNGAMLSDVLEAMAQDGVKGPDGKAYHDGPAKVVNWQDIPTMRAAIATGPMKIAVDANPYERVVQSSNGWFMGNAGHHANYDHCVGVQGYGPIGWLMDQLGGANPPQTNLDAPGYAVFTWGTIGVVDEPSLLNNIGEAWIRTPTTPEFAPAPPPEPGPGPGPPPVAGSYQISGVVTLTPR